MVKVTVSSSCSGGHSCHILCSSFFIDASSHQHGWGSQGLCLGVFVWDFLQRIFRPCQFVAFFLGGLNNESFPSNGEDRGVRQRSKTFICTSILDPSWSSSAWYGKGLCLWDGWSSGCFHPVNCLLRWWQDQGSSAFWTVIVVIVLMVKRHPAHHHASYSWSKSQYF